MSRPLRLEFPGALYHVTSRGDRKALIYIDQTDRLVWLSILEQVCASYNFIIHSFCQMTNHYHLVLETVEGNLTQGMQQLNGIYSQYFNRRHNLVGHVFQGRYKGILVQRETYLLELTRYVVLNPVRANLVALPEEWQWSSYLHFIGEQAIPPWLDTGSTLMKFGVDRDSAKAAYRAFVIAGIGQPSPLQKTTHQIILGDESYIEQIQKRTLQNFSRAINKTQRRAQALSLTDYALQCATPEEAMALAYRSTAYTMEEIGAHFGVSYKTVSRAVKKFPKN